MDGRSRAGTWVAARHPRSTTKKAATVKALSTCRAKSSASASGSTPRGTKREASTAHLPYAPDRHSWTCQKCRITINGTVKQVGAYKAAHLNICVGKFTGRRLLLRTNRADILEVQPDIPEGEASWTCGHCGHGIRKDLTKKNYHVRIAALAHTLEHHPGVVVTRGHFFRQQLKSGGGICEKRVDSYKRTCDKARECGMSKKGEFVTKRAEENGHKLVKTPRYDGLEVCKLCLLRRSVCPTAPCSGKIWTPFKNSGKKMWSDILKEKDLVSFMKKNGFDMANVTARAKYSTHPLAVFDRQRADRRRHLFTTKRS